METAKVRENSKNGKTVINITDSPDVLAIENRSDADENWIEQIQNASLKLYDQIRQKAKKEELQTSMAEKYFPVVNDRGDIISAISPAFRDRMIESVLMNLSFEESNDILQKMIAGKTLDLRQFENKMNNLWENLPLFLAVMVQSGVRFNNVVVNNESYPIVYSGNNENKKDNTLNTAGFIITVEDGATVFANHSNATAVALGNGSSAVGNANGAKAYAIGNYTKARAEAEDSFAFAYGNGSEAHALGPYSHAESYGKVASAYGTGRNAQVHQFDDYLVAASSN